MRLPLASACMFGLLTFLQPTAAQAELVTFTVTVTLAGVSDIGSDAARSAFLARFPVGTQAEITYTFESSTPDCPACRDPAQDNARYYNEAVVTVTVRIADYTATATVGDIIVVNDAVLKIGSKDPSLSCPVYSADIYEVESGGLEGVEAVSGFLLDDLSIQIFAHCSDPSPAGRFEIPTLLTEPPILGQQSNLAGVWFTWMSATEGAVTVAATVSSLTLRNTSTGPDVSLTSPVTLPDGTTSSVSLIFDNVETAGGTTVTASSAGPPPPSGFKLTNPPVYYEISTTATFTGNVRVCLSWTEGQIANESNVQMLHYEGNQWADITDPTSRDTVNNTVCGTTTSFSAFTLMEVKHPFSGFFQPVDNLPTVNAVKAGAAVPVKFSLAGDLGLNILASGYPKAQLMQCATGESIDTIEETVSAGGSTLSYDAVTGFYTYVLQTQKAWANSCRELQLMLNDGEVYKARFTFRK